MKPTTILSLLAFAFGAVSAKDEKAATVVTVSKNNFKDLINSQEPVLVEFFAPWCGHCKKLAPEFEVAANELKSQNIKLAAVDCTVEKEICEERKVRGYPTLAVFRAGQEVTQYSGAREAKAIVKFMKKQAAPAITKINSDDEFKKFRANDDLVVVGYFEDAASAAGVAFTTVAEKMRNDYTFGAMKPTGEHKDGSVVVYKKFDDGESKMTETVTVENLSSFITHEAIPTTAEIGPDNYAKYVESGRPLAYFFYADEKQKEQYLAAVQAAAKTVKGKVNTVFINGGLYGQHADVLNLEQEWPAFSIHDMEKDLKFPFPKGDKMTADSLTKHLQNFVKGSLKPKFKSQAVPTGKQEGNLQVVVHDNFEKIAMDKGKDVMVEIYAPGCGACKMIAPEYEELAGKIAALNKNIVLAKFDGTANDIPSSVSFKLEHFPTFLLFKAKSNELLPFDGDLTYNSLAEFIEKNAENKVSIERKAAKDTASTPQSPLTEDDDDEHDEL